MQEINLFSLNPINEKKTKYNPEGFPYKSALLFRDKKKLIIDGVVIEKQLILSNGCYLIFLSEDCPFEEMLHIYYLSGSFKILDAIELGMIYTEGGFRDFQIMGPKQISFSFYLSDEDKWILTILDKPKISFRPPKFIFHLFEIIYIQLPVRFIKRNWFNFFTKSYLKLKEPL